MERITSIEVTKLKYRKKKEWGKKSENSIQDLRDIIKWSNMHAIGSIAGEEENGKIYIY